MGKKLTKLKYKVILSKDEVNQDVLGQAGIFIISTPQEKYSEIEINHLRKYLSSGGRFWIMMGEGGERNYVTNLNSFLQHYGIKVNSDSVIRNSYYKYFHPKEALVSNGVVNRGLLTGLSDLRVYNRGHQNMVNGDHLGSGLENHSEYVSEAHESIEYVYPFGATLNCGKPSIPILSTGSVCYPLNRPTICFWVDNVNNARSGDIGGRMVVCGSSQMFADGYIEKEDNSLIKDLILDFLNNPRFRLNQIDARNPEISDYHLVPDVAALADRPFCCLQESEDVQSDYTKLFHRELYHVDNISLAAVIRAYDELNMVREPLKLIKPQFEAPLPKLEPAIFPPKFRSITKPSLELFDLDEALSSVPTKLTQIASKCTDLDLEYFIKESGMILSLPEAPNMAPAQILEFIFERIAHYKKVNL